jgi:hypothetical protein
MTLEILVPISTEVIEENQDCIIDGKYKDGALVINVDARKQDHHQQLGLPQTIEIHWGKEYTVPVQELSGLSWPIRYEVTTGEGWYLDEKGNRHFFTPNVKGLNLYKRVSDVVMRAGVFLSIIAGVGCRRAAWLLEVLFHVIVTKSTVDRWIDDIANILPTAEAIIQEMNSKQPITEGHLDELFPRGRGRNSKGKCELVLRDEHGRIIVAEEIAKRDEEHVKPFLMRMKALGLTIKTFYIDHWKAYENAIVEVYPNASIQHDYFHIIQNVWRKVWSYFIIHRRSVKSRSEKVTTAWYQARLKCLAKTLWEKRHLLFKSEERMSQEEKEDLIEIMEEDSKICKMRIFLMSVWSLFRDSKNEEEAYEALAELKKIKIEPKAEKALKSIYSFLEENFDRMITYLKVPGVKRNSLSESGMRMLRRLEVEHDGFRTPKGRQNCIKIYQAVRYLGWSVHNPPPLIHVS